MGTVRVALIPGTSAVVSALAYLPQGAPDHLEAGGTGGHDGWLLLARDTGYDIPGREIAVLFEGFPAAGTPARAWAGGMSLLSCHRVSTR